MDKLRRIPARLDSAKLVADIDLPGYRLHPLMGDLHSAMSRAVRAATILLRALYRQP